MIHIFCSFLFKHSRWIEGRFERTVENTEQAQVRLQWIRSWKRASISGRGDGRGSLSHHNNDTQGKSTCSPPEYGKPPLWRNFVMRHNNTLSRRIKSNSNPTPSPPIDMRRSIWPGPLMNAASCHLLMELPCLGVQCSDTGSAVAKKITRKIKRQNKPAVAHDRQPGPQITH